MLMNVKLAVVVAATVAAVVALPSIGATPGAPVPNAANARDNASRADLYRRALLSGKDVPCRTNASCAALGVAALEAGRIKDAQKLVDMEAALAEATTLQADEDNSPKAASSARARVAMALVHLGDVQVRLGALPNARAYYRTAVSRAKDYPDDALLSRAVAVARQRLDAIAGKAVVSTLPADGARFDSYLFFGAWNSVTVKPVKGRRGVYRIDGDFIYPTVGSDGEPSANMGNLSAFVRFYDGVARVPVSDTSDDAPIDATAKFTNLAAYDKPQGQGKDADKCLLEFRLSEAETLDVVTHGSMTACGFGMNVSANGRYYLKTGS